MPRLEFSRKARATVIARANGSCERCSAVLKPGEGEIDHILPCELGGTNEPVNGMLLCRVCHAEKTAKDVGRIRKGDRQRDKASGAIKPKGTLKSRPFDGGKTERQAKQSLPPRRLYRSTEQ